MNILGSAISPYLAGGAAAIMLALASFGGCQYIRAEAAVSAKERAVTTREAAEADRDNAIEANASNLVTIAAQDKALNQWVNLGVTPEEVRAMLSAASTQARELENLRTKFRALKGKDRDLPDCVELLAISLTRRCPDIAAGVRDAAGRNQDGPG